MPQLILIAISYKVQKIKGKVLPIEEVRCRWRSSACVFYVITGYWKQGFAWSLVLHDQIFQSDDKIRIKSGMHYVIENL